ncbi:CYTH domain-containing protein [Catenovulum sediminis]|uniref:CYTH domain-containing protein n=1 Tax=Catenovulum sediminis TaxID=1740262 RepID=A0ABV1RD43_9ALTE|nr:CYTH domain-containing protein [Catenovulum sediminis]
METEIELKFAVASSEEDEGEPILEQLQKLLTPILQNQGYSHKRLTNTYFDTAQQSLRALDAGLRVRTVDGESEQTLKTAGSSVGGLHKRPEYNIPTTANVPDLSLFPAEAWPDHVSIQDLQDALTPLFTTDFTRHKWRVLSQESLIEVVYDSGAVSAQENHTPIHEIEIELVDGDMRELFSLADILVDKLPLRLSNDSKAARGYRLFLNQPMQDKKSLGTVNLSADLDVETAFARAIEHGLAHWQHHEEIYCREGHIRSLKQLLRGIWLVRHTLWLFRDYVPKKASSEIRKELKWLNNEFEWLDGALHIKQLTSKKGNYRKRIGEDERLLNYLEQTFASTLKENATVPLFYSQRYNRVILKLMRWLTERGWRCYSEIDENLLSENIYSVATKLNQQSWVRIQKKMPSKEQFGMQDYIDVERSIGRGLLTGVCVGSLYNESDRMDFRSPWLDIMEGISDLKTLNLFLQCLDSYTEDNQQELQQWAENKITNLVKVMEQSRQSALKMVPYW